jgi:acyl carrier protein
MDYKLKEKVLQIVNRISGHKINNIDPNADLKTYLTLDSIQIVELFAALEMEFNIELPLEMLNVRSGKEFLEHLEKVLDENRSLSN